MNSNKRPKPVITFFESYDPKSFEDKSSRTPQEGFDQANSKFKPPISKFDSTPVQIAAKPIVLVQNKVEKSNSFFKWIAGFLIFIAVGGLVTWNDNVQTHNSAIKTLQERNDFAKTCFDLDEENDAAKSGPVGSSARLEAVNSFYEKVMTTPCVVWGDGTIIKNEFFKINPKSSNWNDLVEAYNYTLESWNLIEPFRQRCADGWQSPSIGRQGACSYHGGVVSVFNDSKNADIAHFLTSGDQIYPALYLLQDAAK